MKEKRSQDVLLAFRGRQEGMSTSDVASVVYADEFSRIDKVLTSQYVPPQEVRRAKGMKAQLHRRVLYHLNRLIEKELVRVTRTDTSGEKYYALDIDGDEEIVFGDYRKRRLVLSKPRVANLPTGAFEEKKIAVRFGGEAWLDSANAVVLDMEDLSSLYRAAAPLYSEINDVIAVNNFTNHVNANSAEKLVEFCKRMLVDCKDFDRRFSVIVDPSQLSPQGRQRLLQMLKMNAPAEHTVKFIFETSTKELQGNYEFFEEVFNVYKARKVFFKNKDIVKSPYLMGKAGPYTFDDAEWLALDKQPKALVAAQTTLMVDIKKFCESAEFSFNAFEDLMHRTLKTLFSASSMQARRTDACFKHLLNLSGGRDALMIARDYIRFWNYDFLRTAYDSGVMEGVFRIMRKRTRAFCTSQEDIYVSCGMPTRFQAVFSMVNPSTPAGLFSTPLNRDRLEISSLRDFHSDGFRENVRSKELLSDMLGGGFQMTLHKKGESNPEEALREVNILLSTYRLPFFAYEADAPKGELKNLQTFA